MALPKLMHPTFELTVPSVKQKVKFRPFLVKEEKLLLMAKQSGEQADIVNVLKQVINNCDIESVLNIDQLASFDIEYLFLKLRAKSINNIIDLAYTDFEDDEVYKFQLDADEIEITFNPEHNNTIALSEKSGIVMKYPSMDLMSKVLENSDVSSWLFLMIKGCMDQYYEDDKIVMFKDNKPEEVDEFIDNLPTTVIKHFETFFDTMPRLYHKLEYTNKKGTDRVIELRTLEDFFYVALSHNSLENYYQVIFILAQHHNYSISEVENMIVFERDLYLQMLSDHIKKQQENKNNG